uniref:Uncharacterized protein n=1 Tax=viral metagenome TaxID=1070528 RepID=A0A6C0ETI8_9ZZZZ
MPTFINKGKVISLSNLQCIQLELFLNLDDESRHFISLGDKLYNAGTYRKEHYALNDNEYKWIKENYKHTR